MSSTITTTASAASASATCIYYTPGKHHSVPVDDCRALWPYSPSIAAAVIFVSIFGASTILHVIQAASYRKRFCWVIILGSSWETAGFFFRTLSAFDQIKFAFYLPEELLILLAPIWINAFAYMILGRMVYFFLPERKLFGITATRFAVLFVCMDVFAFVIQAVGATMASGGPTSNSQKIKFGLHVYMGGIGLQQCFIVFFTSAVITFHHRMLALERLVSTDFPSKPRWRPLLFTLYAALALISVRIIFRLIQFSSGFTSTIPTHEVFFYFLEATPMSLTLWLLNITHPGRTLIGPESEFPKKARKGKKEDVVLKNLDSQSF